MQQPNETYKYGNSEPKKGDAFFFMDPLRLSGVLVYESTTNNIDTKFYGI